MSDLVSIIMPAYNAGKYIKHSIESVIKQDYPNWELIIVDDCSNDNTKEIVELYSSVDGRVKIISLNNNGGIAKARNIAINHSNGRYIAFLDSDDLWYSDKLTKQILFMKRNNYPFTFTSYEIVGDKGVKTNKIIQASPEVDYRTLLKGNSIGCLTVIIDKDYYQNINMPMIKHEDYATWLQLLKRGESAYGINQVLAQYRKTDNSVSSNKLKALTWTWNIYRSNQKLSVFKCVLCTFSYSINSFKKHYL
jgi:teichuronic acid biosynthesis glycosyltransferase TuaG